MRRELLAATALGSATFLTAWSGGATAATPIAYNWSGTYFGAAFGANAQGPASFNYPSGGSPDTITFTNNTPYFPSYFETGSESFPPFPTSMPAASGGPSIYLGTNWQNGHGIFGWETDLSFLGTSFSQDVSGGDGLPFTDPSDGRTGTFTASGGLNQLFTFRPRIGIAVDKLMLYGTGGLAIGQASLTTGAHLEDFAKGLGTTDGTADWSGSTTAWKTGFVVGGGGEYAINQRMSVRFEALYYNLGSIGVTATGSGSDDTADPNPTYAATSYTASMPLSGTIARVGLTFHLN